MSIIIKGAGVSSVNQSVFPVGTAGVPSIGFVGDLNTGLFHVSAGRLGVVLAGIRFMDVINGFVVMNSGTNLSWTASDSSAGSDTTLSRIAAGNIGAGGLPNGQLTGIAQLAENVTIAAAATSTSVIQLPANAILLGVTSRVVTAGTTSWPVSYSVAIGATTVSSGVSSVATTTDPGTLLCPIQKATATAITITPVGTPGDALGRIRCTIHYLQLTPAIS